MSRESRTCVPNVVTRTPPRTAIPLSTSFYQWREALRCRNCDHSQNSAGCESRWNRTWPRKAYCNAIAASALDTRSETTVTHADASRVIALIFPVVALLCGNSCGEPQGKLSGLCDLETSEGRSCKTGAPSWPKGCRTGHPAAPKDSWSGHLPNRWTRARGAITSSEGACCQGHYAITPIPNPIFSRSRMLPSNLK